MTKTNAPGVLVEVLWLDTEGNSSWMDRRIALASTPPLICTVGFLMLKNKEKLVIASSYGDEQEGNVSDVNTIPAGCVVKIRNL